MLFSMSDRELTQSPRPKLTRFIRLPGVIEITGLKRSSIYSRIKNGEFPTQVRLGGRAVGWVEYEVLEWVADRVREARSKPVQRPPAAAA
jgi:prophage regulatory protein